MGIATRMKMALYPRQYLNDDYMKGRGFIKEPGSKGGGPEGVEILLDFVKGRSHNRRVEDQRQTIYFLKVYSQ